MKLVRYGAGHEQRVDFGDAIANEMLNSRGMDFLMAHPAPMPDYGRAPRTANSPRY